VSAGTAPSDVIRRSGSEAIDPPFRVPGYILHATDHTVIGPVETLGS
jgi:hypothetical protein